MRPIAADYDGTFSDMTDEERQDIDFIVTAENWDDYQNIVDESNPHVPIFFNPGKQTLFPIVDHKAKILNGTNAQLYYDNDEQIIPMLKALCPNCKIVLYKPKQI